jgi:hypothetical protein
MLLNSQNNSKWIPNADIALLYIALCLIWGLQNRLSAMRWQIHRNIIIPMTCYAYDAYDAYDSVVNIVVTAKFITTTYLILVRQTIVVVISPPQYGGFATA